jgi:predicted regulator of Ras-like GTPase activity (Roadblock/LC7/MglB family)
MEIKLKAILADIEAELAEVEASAVLSIDGLMLASGFPEHIHEDRIGSMFAALQSAGHRAGQELAYGGLEQILVGYEKGHALLTRVGGDALIAVLLKSCDEIDRIMDLMRHGASRVEEIISAHHS